MYHLQKTKIKLKHLLVKNYPLEKRATGKHILEGVKQNGPALFGRDGLSHFELAGIESDEATASHTEH